MMEVGGGGGERAGLPRGRGRAPTAGCAGTGASRCVSAFRNPLGAGCGTALLLMGMLMGMLGMMMGMMGNEGQRQGPGWVCFPSWSSLGPNAAFLLPSPSSLSYPRPPAAHRPRSPPGLHPTYLEPAAYSLAGCRGPQPQGVSRVPGHMHPCNPPACPLPGSACPTALSGVTATSPQPQRGAEKPNASPLHIPLHLGCPNPPPRRT